MYVNMNFAVGNIKLIKVQKCTILTKSTRKNSANKRAHITTQANIPKSKTLKCEGSIFQDTLAA